MKGIKLGSGFKLDRSGTKIVSDEAAKHLKLDLCKRIAAKANSAKKIRYGKAARAIPAKRPGE